MEHLYEFSIASQLTGAIILLFWCFKRVSKNAIKMCFPMINCVDVDEDGNGIIRKELLRKNVQTIFLNVWAFLCIILGYLSSVGANNDGQDLCEKILWIGEMTIALSICGYLFSVYASKGWFSEDAKLKPEELEKYSVLTSVTSKDIKALFEGNKASTGIKNNEGNHLITDSDNMQEFEKVSKTDQCLDLRENLDNKKSTKFAFPGYWEWILIEIASFYVFLAEAIEKTGVVASITFYAGATLGIIVIIYSIAIIKSVSNIMALKEKYLALWKQVDC